MNDIERLRMLAAEAMYQACLNRGDFIEMGVFRGGSAVVLASALRMADAPRTLYLLDSWEGLPNTHEKDQQVIVGRGVFSMASEGAVASILEKQGLLRFCSLQKGWFKDTLIGHNGPFALAHIDCDLYEPTKTCLEHVLPRMTENAVVIIDDFGNSELRRFPGVIQAVREVLGIYSEWSVCALGGSRDQSVKLVRTIRI